MDLCITDESTSDSRDTIHGHREIPSFIVPRPPFVTNPFINRKKSTAERKNLLEFFEEETDELEPELVHVYLRLKPTKISSKLYDIRNDKSLITHTDTKLVGNGRRPNNVSKMYTFSHIFNSSATQKEIFNEIVKDNLRKLADGQSYTLLTYGASGSGKTYTLMGTEESPGLIPRSLEYVFKVVDAAQHPLHKPSDGGADKLTYLQQNNELQWVSKLRSMSSHQRDTYRRMSVRLSSEFTSSMSLFNRTQYYVWVSFVEIYNEAIYDLLVTPEKRGATKLMIREDPNGQAYVKGASQAFVRSGAEAYDVMMAGKLNLQVAATGVHAHSSRSHCIFTITLLTDAPENHGVKTACVRLCDLAGSERANRTRNTGARMAESRAINTSLHVLERCLHALRRKQTRPESTLVPYRESKLTRLLGSGLSGTRGEPVTMVVTVNPSPEDVHETRHVLQLAAVAKDIQINNTLYETSSDYSKDDSSINSTTEILNLRADNERMLFEIEQLTNKNEELKDQQEKSSRTLQEVVQEVKDMTNEYHTAILKATEESYKCEIEELKTARQLVQGKVDQSLKIVAIIENKLNIYKHDISSVSKYVYKLRRCLEQGNEVSEIENTFKKDESYEQDINESYVSKLPEDEKVSLARQSSVIDLSDLSEDSTYSEEDTKDNRDDDNVSHNNYTDDASESNVTDSINLPVKNLDKNNSRTEESSLNDSVPIANSEAVSVDPRKSYTIKINHNKEPLSKISKLTLTRFSINTLGDESLAMFEEVEREMKNDNLSKKKTNQLDIDGYKLKTVKDRVYFSNINDNMTKNVVANIVDTRSPSIVTDEFTEECSPTIPIIKKRNLNIEKKFCIKEQVSLDIFEEIDSPQPVFTDAAGCDDSSVENRDNLTVDRLSLNLNNLKIKRNEGDYFSYESQLEKEKLKCVDTDKNFDSGDKEFTKISISELHSKNTTSDDVGYISVTETNTQESLNIEPHNMNQTYEHQNVDESNKPKLELCLKDCISNEIIFNKYKSTDIINYDINTDRNTHKKDKQNSVIIATEINDTKSEFKKPQVKVKNSVVSKLKELNTEIYTKKNCKSSQSSQFKDDCNKLVASEVKLKHSVTELYKENPVKIIPTEKENLHNLQKIDSFSIVNNTVDDFENLFKNTSVARSTEFDLLVSQNSININENVDNDDTKTKDKINDESLKQDNFNKLSLRHKSPSEDEVSDNEKVSQNKETVPKETKNNKIPKRNLRLKRKNTDIVESEGAKDEEAKLKNIKNLQLEFCDVIMDKPAPMKSEQDIESPENNDVIEEIENVAPPGIQSCPVKITQKKFTARTPSLNLSNTMSHITIKDRCSQSFCICQKYGKSQLILERLTRSRRKLFTPRPEPLEESMSAAADSNERIYIPRPSYHRGRARRKL